MPVADNQMKYGSKRRRNLPPFGRWFAKGSRLLSRCDRRPRRRSEPGPVRCLRERCAEVQVVMAAAAREFVTPTAFQAVCERAVPEIQRDRTPQPQQTVRVYFAEAVSIRAHTNGTLLRCPLMRASPGTC